uniref:Uncharacterized protein n=1 Tax=Arundo donax TaxID=35708 RepID=A0A0A9H533_ARUDO
MGTILHPLSPFRYALLDYQELQYCCGNLITALRLCLYQSFSSKLSMRSLTHSMEVMALDTLKSKDLYLDPCVQLVSSGVGMTMTLLESDVVILCHHLSSGVQFDQD